MAKRARSYRFEMPYHVDAPILTDPAAGIDRLRLRAPNSRNTTTLTLLDTTDDRLSWAGVLLAHRTVGDTAHWLLRASDWQPWLPAERIEPLNGDDELPEDIAELLRPFRRRAPIGPVASISVDRAAYQLLDRDDIELGQLLDDRVTVRRGGLAVARRREVTLEPGNDMTSAQRSLVADRLHAAGGMRVTEFTDPVERLATLGQPVAVPAEPPADVDAEDFLAWSLSSQLFGVLRADLQVRAGEVADTALLTEALAQLADQVRGLQSLVDPVWASELCWHIGRLADRPPSRHPRELGESYFDTLDALAPAARAPRLRPDLPVRPAGEPPASARDLLRADAAARLADLVTAVDALDADADETRWSAALATAEQVLRVLNAGEPVLGKYVRRRRRVVKLLAALGAAVNALPEPHPEVINTMAPADAYRAGREYQRRVDEVREPRRDLLKSWPKIRGKLLDEWPEVDATSPGPARLAAPDEPKAVTASAGQDDDE